MSNLKKTISYPSVIVLIVVNLIPLIGVLFFQWDIFTIIFLYWLESAVIGIFNFFKMIKINGGLNSNMLPFFIIHYGGFTLGTLILIIFLFRPDLQQTSSELQAFFIALDYARELLLALFFLIVSHSLSFIYNFMEKKEYLQTNLGQQMIAPYKRVVIMNLVIILSSYWLKDVMNIMTIVILVVLKIIFDLLAHLREHRKIIFN